MREFVNREIDKRRAASLQANAQNNAAQQNVRNIRTIFGGPETGDSSRKRKSYEREARDVQIGHRINMAEHIYKFSKTENVTIIFTEDEAHQVIQPHIDALVESLRIANNQVHRVLIDNGSSADVLFKSVLDQMDLGRALL